LFPEIPGSSVKKNNCSKYQLIKGKIKIKIDNRSQVQGSTFRVKDKEGIKDPKFSLKMFISQIIANLVFKNKIFIFNIGQQ
jgi:hypothetical protein